MSDKQIEEHTWLRQPGEPETWFLRFNTYLRQGRSRSKLGVYNAERAEKGVKKALRISGAWDRKIVQYAWDDRAREYDRYRDMLEEAATERKRREWKNKAISLSEDLTKKAEQMLQWPLSQQKQETTTSDGKTTVINIFNPSKWGIRDAASIIETADKLIRLALTMETENLRADVVVGESIEDVRRKRWSQIADKLAGAFSELNEETDMQNDE